MSDDAAARRTMLEFELALDAEVCDEFRRESWGGVYLSPSLPRVWDASAIAVEEPGLSAATICKLADEAYAGTGLEHRTAVVCDEEDGKRVLAEELPPGWRTERVLYMAWRDGKGRHPTAAVAETTTAAIGELRSELIRDSLDPEDAAGGTVEQLIANELRYDAPAGDLWFLAPAAESLAACRLLVRGGIGQVEDVATLVRGRGRGLAQAVVLAAVARSRAAGHTLTFLAAEADDWPRLLYAKLGFEVVGELAVLRRT